LEALKKLFSFQNTSWFLVLILAIVIPPAIGGYLTSLLILISIWAIMTISINLIYGYTGQLSLGHAGFFAIGAYSMGLLTVTVGLSFWLAFLASIAIVGLGGLLIGFPSLKSRGPYFVLVTLSFAVIIHKIIVHWDSLTGGANGIQGIPRPPSIPLPFNAEVSFRSQLSIYYLALFFLVLIFLINYRLVHSLVGKTFVAISRDENLSQSLGINTMRRKLLSFIISTIYAGVAGILFATYNSVITPHLGHFTQGLNAIVYLVVGGSATMAGPFVGTLVLVAIPEVLQMVPYLKTLINGIILLIFIIFLPSGIMGGINFLIPNLESVLKRLRKEGYGTS
jgi:branched-chain amino acid transport system permease protein